MSNGQESGSAPTEKLEQRSADRDKAAVVRLNTLVDRPTL